MSLLDNLNELCEAVYDEVPAINRGGCAIFTVAVGRALQKLGIPAWANALRGGYEGNTRPAWEVRKLLVSSNKAGRYDPFTWEDNGFYFNHVVPRFSYEGQVYQVDAEEGVMFPSSRIGRWQMQEGNLTLHEVEQMVKVRPFWNTAFNRRRNIPVINRLVKEYLSRPN